MTTTKKNLYVQTATHNVWLQLNEKDVNPAFGPFMKLGLAWEDADGFDVRINHKLEDFAAKGKIVFTKIEGEREPSVGVAPEMVNVRALEAALPGLRTVTMAEPEAVISTAGICAVS